MHSQNSEFLNKSGPRLGAIHLLFCRDTVCQLSSINKTATAAWRQNRIQETKTTYNWCPIFREAQ